MRAVLRLTTLALVALSLVPSVVVAQGEGAPPETEAAASEGLEAAAELAEPAAGETAPIPARPLAERRAGDPPADELADVSSGAPIGPGRGRHVPIDEPARGSDASDPQLPAMWQLHIGMGGAVSSSLDGALVAHLYASSALVFAVDVTVGARVLPWLELAGRVGARGRGWGHAYEQAALAGGVDALGLVVMRGYVGRVVDLGVAAGVGIGVGGLSLHSSTVGSAAPRLHGALFVGFRVAPGVRLLGRFSWDWFSLYDIDRLGSDLELGGPMGSLGVEVRS
jgi:hypothetical protein